MKTILKLVIATLFTVSTVQQDQIINLVELEDFLLAFEECGHHEFAGLTLSIVHGNKTQLGQFGKIDNTTNRAVNVNTKFGIGSVTKSFTAALLVQQLEKKGLTINETARDIWGDDFELATDQLTRLTNVQDLLAHRVGVAGLFGGYLMAQNMSRQELMRKIKHLPVSGAFRNSFIYNNFMFSVGGMLAEKLAGDRLSWESLIQENILKPNGMTSTTFAYDIVDWNDNNALPHYLKDGSLIPTSPDITAKSLVTAGPAGTIFSTGIDMAKWMRVFLNPKENGTISRKTIETVTTPHSYIAFGINPRIPVNITVYAMGLGWALGFYRDQQWKWHNGFVNNYCSMVSLLPDSNLGVFVSTNGASVFTCNAMVQSLHFWIFEKVLGYRQPWINKTNVCYYTKYPEFKAFMDIENLDNSYHFSTKIADFNQADLKQFDKDTSDFQQGIKTAADLNQADQKTADNQVDKETSDSKQASKTTELQGQKTADTSILIQGNYNHDFLGRAQISLNQTVNMYQFQYGQYGRALLKPTSDSLAYELDFQDALWYITNSDDMKFLNGSDYYHINFVGNSSNATSFKMQMFDWLAVPEFKRI